MTEPAYTEHIHRWQIEPPNGPKSWGECACGARRQFENTLAVDRGGAESAISAVACRECGQTFVNRAGLASHLANSREHMAVPA